MTGSAPVPEMFDVIVVGAGPAGSAAAAAVRQSDPTLRVLVVDKADFPRDKACGDGIAFEVGETLNELGFDVSAIFDGYRPLQRLAVRSPGGVEVNRLMAREVHVVPRAVFDGRLVDDLRRRGIEVRRHTVRRIELTSIGVILDGVFAARVLIGADGAESVVRRNLGVRRAAPGRVALAIRGYAPELPPAQTQFITMTEQHWPAYAWSFPIGDGRANVGYGEILGAQPPNRAEMLANLHRLLPGLTAAPENLQAHRLPLSSGRPAIADGPVLLVGDAQSMINPFTGEGIFYAVLSGLLAGRSAAGSLAAGGDAGRDYRLGTRQRLGRHLRHTTALARLSGWTGLLDAGLRAARDDQRSFDDLVRFGLADGLLTPRLVSRLRLK